MTINFTSGLIKAGDWFIKPENITYITPDGEHECKVYNNAGTCRFIEKPAEEVAKGAVQAEQTGQIIDLDA
jgi:hypothetical protein